MAGVTVVSDTPLLKFYGKAYPYYRNPNLYVVGEWANRAEVAGDASGASVSIYLKILPTEKILPYLPQLQCFYTFTNIQMFSDNGTDKCNIQVVNSFGVAGGVTTEVNVHSFATVLVETGHDAAAYQLPGDLKYDHWIIKTIHGTSSQYVNIFLKPNTNAKQYHASVNGLLLKDRDQLRTENLEYLLPKPHYIKTGWCC